MKCTLSCFDYIYIDRITLNTKLEKIFAYYRFESYKLDTRLFI